MYPLLIKAKMKSTSTSTTCFAYSPPKPSSTGSNSRRFTPGNSAALRIGSSRRATAWPVVSTGSPRSHPENDGYNSADEQNPCFGSSYDDAVSSSRFTHFKELNNNQTNTVYTFSKPLNHKLSTLWFSISTFLNKNQHIYTSILITL